MQQVVAVCGPLACFFAAHSSGLFSQSVFYSARILFKGEPTMEPPCFEECSKPSAWTLVTLKAFPKQQCHAPASHKHRNVTCGQQGHEIAHYFIISIPLFRFSDELSQQGAHITFCKVLTGDIFPRKSFL